MSSRRFPRLRRVCDAVPKSTLDEQLESLSVLQRLLVFVVTGVAVVTVAPVLTDADGVPVVAVALAFGTMGALAHLIAWYNRR